MNEQGPLPRVNTSVRCSPRSGHLAGLLLAVGCGIGFPGGLNAAEPKSAPLFSRHIVPTLARLGCNAGGSCHGTLKGQNGFRLSLFGGQPAADHDRLTREFNGRRLDFHDPDRSLVLLKATGRVPHGGGKRTEVGSTDYRVLRDWIAAGAPFDDVGKSRVARLAVSPVEQVLRVGESCRLQVMATYADGTTADVTDLCRHETRDGEVAAIDPSGTVRALRVGDTVAVIRYGAEPVLAGLLVVPVEANKSFPEVKAHNFIDEHVLARLRAMGVPPAAVCDDATFLRRLYLDAVGHLPPAEEVRAFLADRAADKRDKKIDEVLAKPGHAEVWAAKFSDLIKPVERGNEGSNNLVGGQVLRIRFYEWLRARLQENVPYDKLVERIFVSSSLEGRPVAAWAAEFEALRDEVGKKKDRPVGEPLLVVYNARRTLDLYWERDGATGVSGAVQFAHAFLGLRLQCAQCHRHPYDVWQQDDLLGFANFFTAMNTIPGQHKNSPDVEAHAARLKPEIAAWTEEVKKLSASKVAADKTRVAQVQAKIAAAQALIAAEVAPLTVPVGTVRVTSPLGTQESRVARLLGEKTPADVPVGADRRKVVIEWLHRPDNPFFARAIVNRVWAHYLGRGLVDPPDNLSPLNPPSHPKLLDELCQGFIKSSYDLRWLHRTILRSRTYQQSHESAAAGRPGPRHYTRFQVRRLPGEVILDVLNQATGAREKYPGGWMFREGEKAILTAGVMVDVYNFYNINDPFRYLVFGRQLRRTNVQCDCEQGNDTALPQWLFMANHEEVRKKIADDKGRAAQLAANGKLTNRQRLEELFLAALGRPPDAREMQAGLDHLETSETLRKGLEEVLWSLVNTREFQLSY